MLFEVRDLILVSVNVNKLISQLLENVRQRHSASGLLCQSLMALCLISWSVKILKIGEINLNFRYSIL